MKLAAALPGAYRQLRFRLAVAGWPGAVGLALAVAAAMLQFVLVPQQQGAAESARAEADRQHRNYLRAAEGGRGTVPDTGQSLARFRQLLSQESGADEALEIIQRDARSRGLSPGASEYKWLRQPQAKLAQVQIAMPVKGGYEALRGFVADVMADVPGLALDQFELQRDNIAVTMAETRLRFTLYLRSGS